LNDKYMYQCTFRMAYMSQIKASSFLYVMAVSAGTEAVYVKHIGQS